MSQIIKSFLGVFIMLFLTATSIGILSAYMEVLNAQDMQARIVDELENSNYAPVVMRSGFDMAGLAGCKLTVTLYYENGGSVVIRESSAVPHSIDAVNMARVELTFPFEVAVLGIRKEHTISGYAR